MCPETMELLSEVVATVKKHWASHPKVGPEVTKLMNNAESMKEFPQVVMAWVEEARNIVKENVAPVDMRGFVEDMNKVAATHKEKHHKDEAPQTLGDLLMMRL